MPTLNIKDIPESKVVKLVDLSEDSITRIAEAVVRKIVDAEPLKHGHWKGKPIAGYSDVRCSNCGDVFMENSGNWNYCPCCGAKMDEAIDEWEEPEINPCRCCIDYDGRGECKSNGGCGR